MGPAGTFRLTAGTFTMGAPKYPTVLVQRASKLTGKSTRQVRRWAKQGCNLHDDISVLSFNEFRGPPPANFQPNFAQAIKAVAEITPPAIATTPKAPPKEPAETFDLKLLDRLPAPGEEGAAAALKRLQGLETIFYARLIGELSVSGSPHLVTTAQNDYNKVTESLRKYEQAVEESRRDLGHLLPKQEAQDGARAAALWFRLAWRLWLSSSLPDLLAIKDARTAKAQAEASFSEILLVSFKNAAEAKLSIPDWALPVIREEFHVQ